MLPTCTITLGDNTYTCKLPNNRQLIDIEVMKTAMSKAMFASLDGNTVTGLAAVQTISMVAYFTVLYPKLLKDLLPKGTELLDLDPIKNYEVLKAYKEQFFPWMKQWIDAYAALAYPETNKTLAEASNTVLNNVNA